MSIELQDRLNAGYTGDPILHVDALLKAEDVCLALDKLHTGKASGHDQIVTEHITHCHPVIYALLAKLFNIMIFSGYVPDDFGVGILIPIPKSDSTCGTHKLENFRGITLSPVISKIFEHCILLVCSEYFVTSDNQFGFKSKVGCSHAIYTLRHVIDYHARNYSTLNMCFVDVSKAFDRVSHPALFIKLLNRNVPRIIVIVLHNWYTNLSNYVQWGNHRSDVFTITAGVRQGGILSPFLFTIYVNDMLDRLNDMGCSFHGYIIGAIMYADDLIFMSNSVYQLQLMLQVCQHEISLLDLKINLTKSVCMRVGHRFNIPCAKMSLGHGEIDWSDEVKYLGIYIKSGRDFMCDMTNNKKKFYRSSNAIFSKLSKFRNNMVVMKLICSISLPTLIYANEALNLTKSQILSLDHTWTKAFFKVFSTFDMQIIRQCQLYGGYMPYAHIYAIARMNFLTRLKYTENKLINFIAFKTNPIEINELSATYNVSDNLTFVTKYRKIVQENFKNFVTS